MQIFKFYLSTKLENFLSIKNNTVPTPIKDAASIQKIFFQLCTMVHFLKISFIFVIHNCTKFNKMHLFLTFFKVQLLFKSVLYWRGYGIYLLFGAQCIPQFWLVSVYLHKAVESFVFVMLAQKGHFVTDFWVPGLCLALLELSKRLTLTLH